MTMTPLDPDAAGLQLWHRRVAEISDAWRELPAGCRDALAPRLAEIRRLKERLQQLADGVAAGGICARCGGECCRSGRYHVTVTDVVVYLAAGDAVPEPSFRPGACPYLGPAGCIFPPAFRPFNCITFNCDRIEALLAPPDLEAFCRDVASLRTARQAVADLLAGRLRTGILLD